MNALTKKIIGVGFALLLSVNAYFVRDLVQTLKETALSGAQTQASVAAMGKEIGDMKESVRGLPELRIDVAVLKFAVQQMQTSINEAKKKGSQ